METYHGGLQCCKHSWFLTDLEQDQMIPKDKVYKKSAKLKIFTSQMSDSSWRKAPFNKIMVDLQLLS